jgi:hypothetical protein
LGASCAEATGGASCDAATGICVASSDGNCAALAWSVDLAARGTAIVPDFGAFRAVRALPVVGALVVGALVVDALCAGVALCAVVALCVAGALCAGDTFCAGAAAGATGGASGADASEGASTGAATEGDVKFVSANARHAAIAQMRIIDDCLP